MEQLWSPKLLKRLSTIHLLQTTKWLLNYFALEESHQVQVNNRHINKVKTNLSKEYHNHLLFRTEEDHSMGVQKH
jgi:hypothetical protein